MTSCRKLNIEGGLMQSRRNLQKKNEEKNRSENCTMMLLLFMDFMFGQ